jgi:flagellar L-ring protein precursor FlgH
MNSRLVWALCLAGSLSACGGGPQPIVSGPLTARPIYPMRTVENQGSIYQPSTAQLLFEEQTAHAVGDTLKIAISESLTGSTKSNTSNDHETSLNQKGPGAGSDMGGLLRSIFEENKQATGKDTFKGTGSTDNSSTVTGTMTVMVVEVLPNNDLVVAGDKAIALNGNASVLRFSGIVNRRNIKAGNVVASSDIANARLEQVGQGTVAEANARTSYQQFFRDLLVFW